MPTKKISWNTKRKQAEKLRRFRHDMSILKKKGVLKTKKNVRDLTPNSRLNKLRNEFKDVLTGKARVWTVKGAVKTSAKDAGYVVHGNKISLPESQFVSRSGKEKGRIKTHIGSYLQKNEITGKIRRVKYKSVMIPTNFSKIADWFDAIAEQGHRFDEKLPNGMKWAFTFYGNNSYQTFNTLLELERYLARYNSITMAMQKGIRSKEKDLLRSIEVIQVFPGAWERPLSLKEEIQNKRLAEYRERKKEQERLHPELKKKRHRFRVYRKIRSDMTPEQREAYNKAGRERARKSYEKRKGNK